MNEMSGQTFCEAAWNGDITRIQRLLAGLQGATCDPCSAVDMRGYTPLHYAASLGHLEIMTAFLTCGENALSRLEVRDLQAGNTPLLQAVAAGREDMAQLLIEFGADVNAQNYAGESSLILAVRAGLSSLVSLLLESGADARTADLDGASPLHAAVANSDAHLVGELLNHGAMINSADNEGDTPLHWAVRNSDAENVMIMLMRRGADIFAKNEDGETALDLAVALNEIRFQQILSQQVSLIAAFEAGQKRHFAHSGSKTMPMKQLESYYATTADAMDIDVKPAFHSAAAAPMVATSFGRQAVF